MHDPNAKWIISLNRYDQVCKQGLFCKTKISFENCDQDQECISQNQFTKANRQTNNLEQLTQLLSVPKS